MQRLVAVIIGLACIAALGNATDNSRPGVPAVPETNLSSTANETVALDPNGYALFTRAIAEVIEGNAEDIQQAISEDAARQALLNVRQTAANNDAARASTSAGSSAQPAGTIAMGGQVIPYVDSYWSAAAPASGAGLWNGNDSTTDGSWGYFIGHNPGDFSCMLSMGIGSPVTIVDKAGSAHTYTVVLVFDVPYTTTWQEVSGTVTSYGESIALQTCIDDGQRYRIMVAA